MTAMTKLFTGALLASFGVSTAACGDKSTGAGSSEAAGSGRAAGSAAASATGAAAAPALPKDADEKVVAELKKFSTCEREDGHFKGECEASKAWDDFSEKYTEDDDEGRSKAGKLVRACYSLVGDANDGVREAATDCVVYYGEALDDKKGAIRTFISRIPTEKSEGVRSSQARALDTLDPVKNGGAAEVLAIAKSLLGNEDTRHLVSPLMDALTPRRSEGEPDAESIKFAIELTKDMKYNPGRSVGATVLGHAPSKAGEVCPALLALVETKKHPYFDGLRAMADLKGACSAQYDAVITVLLAKLEEGEGYDKGFGAIEAIYLTRMLEHPGFTPEQKKKLLGPVEKRAAAEKNETSQKSFADLVAKLK